VAICGVCCGLSGPSMLCCQLFVMLMYIVIGVVVYVFCGQYVAYPALGGHPDEEGLLRAGYSRSRRHSHHLQPCEWCVAALP